MLEKLLKGALALAARVAETWDIETLTDAGETPRRTIQASFTLLQVDGNALLFTADAGIPALTQALDLLDGASFDSDRLRFVQVPHHGSQRNVERFLSEHHRARSLPIPSGYAFSVAGALTPPNLMQYLTASLVRDRRRLGNWSGTGAGKTLAAVYASRIIGGA